MIGAILGDIIGSPYEFDCGNKSKEFPLFCRDSVITDDTVMTLAVAKGFLDAGLEADDDSIRKSIADAMREVGRQYPEAGYGARFGAWLYETESGPYNSFGNGSAMRVSSAAWLFDDLEGVCRAARLSAEVTHNHPEGMRGAEAAAAAIFLARSGSTKTEIKDYIEKTCGYDLSRSCDEIRPGYHRVESCQKTVPEAITAFLEGNSFEDVIRTAVSLGGDSDTIAAIAGSIAEGFYGVPEELRRECRSRLDERLLGILERFEGHLAGKTLCPETLCHRTVSPDEKVTGAFACGGADDE
ncbi:MAG: ADP-ribosylglycohydrolase family protein [Oscillibacter sp.]|nr:ADP-ribosylglycohydrolase family protein [Oscillibacter sp.]